MHANTCARVEDAASTGTRRARSCRLRAGADRRTSTLAAALAATAAESRLRIRHAPKVAARLNRFGSCIADAIAGRAAQSREGGTFMSRRTLGTMLVGCASAAA